MQDYDEYLRHNLHSSDVFPTFALGKYPIVDHGILLRLHLVHYVKHYGPVVFTWLKQSKCHKEIQVKLTMSVGDFLFASSDV